MKFINSFLVFYLVVNSYWLWKIFFYDITNQAQQKHSWFENSITIFPIITIARKQSKNNRSNYIQAISTRMPQKMSILKNQITLLRSKAKIDTANSRFAKIDTDIRAQLQIRHNSRVSSTLSCLQKRVR